MLSGSTEVVGSAASFWNRPRSEVPDSELAGALLGAAGPPPASATIVAIPSAVPSAVRKVRIGRRRKRRQRLDDGRHATSSRSSRVACAGGR